MSENPQCFGKRSVRTRPLRSRDLDLLDLPSSATRRDAPAPYAWLAQRKDRPTALPAHLIAGPDGTPPTPVLIAAVAQQVAIQLVYGIVALLVAGALHLGPQETIGFLALSMLVLAGGGALQVLRRGPIGSGYGLSLISGISMLAPYALAAEAGATPGQIGLLCITAGLIAALFLTFDRRLLASIPSDVAGVVTFSIGAAVAARAPSTLGLDLEASDTAARLAAGLFTFMCTGLIALVPGLVGRFALPLSAAGGSALALLLGFHHDGAWDKIAAASWIALPAPVLPTATLPDLALLPAFLIGVLATLLASQSSLLVIQRAGDATWRRADLPPIRRGLLAVALTMAGAGAIGGMAPVVSSANVALSVQARVLSRSVVLFGSATLVLLALSPKMIALLVLMPPPVKAALLLYLGCVMMAAGCQAVAARALDARRTLVVGAGLSAALLVLASPPAIIAALPLWLRSPMMAGAMTALSLHLLTIPLVAKRKSLAITLGPAAGQDISDRCAAVAGAWGLRKDVATRLERALVELAEALAARGQARLEAKLNWAEDAVEVRLRVEGEPLPTTGGGAPPTAEDLLLDDAALERFTVWMALRQAEQVSQRSTGAGRHELSFLISGSA